MSEFYKLKRDLVIKNYKYLGIKEKVLFYFFHSTMIIIPIALCYQCVIIKSENCNAIWLTCLLLIVMLFCSYLSKKNKEKYQEDKKRAVSQFAKNPDINIEIIDVLIKEIDRYIKKMNTFATWITGLAATFVILLATSTTNYFFELYNAYLNLISKYELLSIIENYSHSAHINVFLYVCGSLLLIFLILVLIIYNLFDIFTFIKVQMLALLFDVKYELLSNMNQK